MKRIKKDILIPIIALAIFILPICWAFADNDVFLDDFAGGLSEAWQFYAWIDDYGVDAVENQGVIHVFTMEDNDVRIFCDIDVDKNSFYKLSCNVKTAGVNGGAGANISIMDSLAVSDGVFGDSDWQRVELIGRTGKKQDMLSIAFGIGGYGLTSVGEAWFDDIRLEKLDSYSGEYKDFSAASTSSGSEDDKVEKSAEGDFPYIGKIMLVMLAMALASLLIYRRFIETQQKAISAENEKNEGVCLIIILIFGFLMRVFLSYRIFGHPTDINCFMAWGYNLAEDGFATFYTKGMFADYPPGYMYVLYITSKIAKLLNISYASNAYALITKMPGICADILSAYIVYRMTKKTRENDSDLRSVGYLPLVLAALVALNPLYMFISGGWGQIDQILALMLLLSIWLFSDKKEWAAGLIYGIAIMVKPQALMVGPLFAVAYIIKIWNAETKTEKLKQLAKTALAVAAAVLTIILLAEPFRGSQNFLWFLDKLWGTATSYNYASIEAFNFMALLGGNWRSAADELFIFTYGQYGAAFIILSVVAAIALYIKGAVNKKGINYTNNEQKKKGILLLCAAYLIIALFCLGHYMHERYIIPALLLLMCAFIYYKDKRLFVSFLWLCMGAFFNACLAFIITSNSHWRTGYYTGLMVFGTLMNLGGFAYLSYACFDIVFGGKKHPAFAEKPCIKETLSALPKPIETKLGFNRKDRLFVGILTLTYGVIALLNLGTTVAPENSWQGETDDTVAIQLENAAEIKQIWVYGGIAKGGIIIEDAFGKSATYAQENDDMFRWKKIDASLSGSDYTLKVTDGSIWLNEVVFVDENGQMIAASSVEAKELFDEGDTFREDPTSYMYGMYFDELYHARTAYEHLHGLKPYENSHPPLGKVLIMLGIAIFGMNPLGWRIVGALFGVAMVPIMYAFAKRILKNSEYALLAAGLFAFDFMHYTQTRIATIDVYGVFFIILMFYYMYQYYSMNFFVDGLKKTLKPLALGGLFFGLGAACKWIDIYAGLGMAVLLFTSLGKRYSEYVYFSRGEDKEAKKAVAAFWPNLIKTLLWCCLFYIAVPVAIYGASYLPYVLSEAHYDINGIIGLQEFMLKYHGGLQATHAYQSPWWQWPLIIRPMWYYVNYGYQQGNIGTISAMGNPAVWWVCAGASVVAIIKLVRGRIKVDGIWYALIIGLAAEFIPWVLVSRCTFIYHYFASVPFIILIAVRLLMLCEQKGKVNKAVKWVWLFVAIGLFVLFYPVITGTECSKTYVKILEWLPSWTFLGY